MARWCILESGNADVMGHGRGKGAGVAPERPPAREDFIKQGPKQGLLAHSEQIVNCGGGHWITSFVFCIKI